MLSFKTATFKSSLPCSLLLAVDIECPYHQPAVQEQAAKDMQSAVPEVIAYKNPLHIAPLRVQWPLKGYTVIHNP